MTAESKPLISKTLLICATIALWLVVCAVVELPRIAHSATVATTGDLYAHNWPFQLIVFAVFRFPLWLIGLLLFLMLEFALLTRRRPHNEDSSTRA
jgi:hypothetical protein